MKKLETDKYNKVTQIVDALSLHIDNRANTICKDKIEETINVLQEFVNFFKSINLAKGDGVFLKNGELGIVQYILPEFSVDRTHIFWSKVGVKLENGTIVDVPIKDIMRKTELAQAVSNQRIDIFS